MTGPGRGPRRTDHQYDKTDLFLLGGGAVLVLLGLGLAADSWLAPNDSPAEQRPAFAASADSARARFQTRAAPDSGRAAAPPAAVIDTAPAPDSSTVATPTRPPGVTVVEAAAPARAPASPSAGAAAPATPATAPAQSLPGQVPPRRPREPISAVPGHTGSWSVQAGAFGSRENADRLARVLEAQGFTTEVVQTDALHRVRATGFVSRAAAVAAQARIAAAAGSTAVLIPPSP